MSDRLERHSELRLHRHSRDMLTFEIGWIDPGKHVGSVSRPFTTPS
jgi:hypothetical protein